MNPKCLVMEWKMIWQNMWRNYQNVFYQKRRSGWSLALKPTKVTLFIMIFYNSEKSIHNLRPFCRPLFCHSSVVMYTSSPLRQWHSNETWLTKCYWNLPPNLAGFICICCELHWQKNSFICYTHWEYWWHNWRMRRKFLKRVRNDPQQQDQPSLSSLMTIALFQNVTL